LALTIVTAAPALDFTGAFGSPYISTIEVSSDVGLLGSQIQLRHALFGNPANPDAPDALQAAAYIVDYPSSNGANVELLPMSGLSPTRWIYSVRLTRIDNTSFTVETRFLNKMDERVIWTTTPNPNNIFRFEKSVNNNPNIDNNDPPSAYNAIREIWTEVTSYDLISPTAATHRALVQPKFFCDYGTFCNIYGSCIINGVTNWTSVLYRNSEVVTNLSIHTDTILTFRCLIDPSITPLKYYVAVYRKDNANNVSPYWTDLEFNMAQVDPGNLVSGVPMSPFNITAFTSALDMVNSSGNTWEAEITLNKSYFTDNAVYRAYLVIEGDDGHYYSCNTKDLIANDCPPVVGATITSDVYQYDSGSTVYSNEDQFFNVATRGRIKIDSIFSKTSYNSNIPPAGQVGSWDTRNNGVEIAVLDYYPGYNEIVNGTAEVPLELLSEDATQITHSTEFQIPETWSGTTKYVVFIYKFRQDLAGRFCNEQIKKIFKLTMRLNDEVGLLQFTPVFKDQDDNVITEICLDEITTLKVCYTEIDADVFDFIPVIRAGGSGLYGEYDPYTNTEMDELTSSLVETSDVDTTGGEACYTIDAENLIPGIEYDFGAVFISQGATSPPVCVNIAYTSLLTRLESSTHHYWAEYDFDLTPLVSADILQVEITWSVNGLPPSTSVFTTATGTIEIFQLMNGAQPTDICFDVSVTLASGCSYLGNTYCISNIGIVGPVTSNLTFTPT